MPARYEGARPQAWLLLGCLAVVGTGLGSLGYFDKLALDAGAWPAFHSRAGQLLLLGSAFITAFLNVALTWAANRHGRPLSLLSLLLYPLFNVLGEGLLLVFVFDLGRWLRPLVADKGASLRWADFGAALGTSALESRGMEDPLLFREFMFGFAPYTLLHAVLHSFLYEEHILPNHLVLDAPNTFMKAIVVAQFSYIALYYATGDVASYCLMRALGDLLTVVAVRMPPPGVRAPAAPKRKAA